MSVVSVTEITSGMAGEDNEAGSLETRVFRVVTNDPRDGSFVVRRAGGIPRRGDGHNLTPGMTADRISARPEKAEESRLLWLVEVSYKPQTIPDDGGGGGGGDPPQPNTELEIVLGYDPVTKITEKDAIGNPILNAATDKYGDGVEVDTSLVSIEIRNAVAFDKITLELVSEWRDAVHGPVIQPQLGVANPLAFVPNNPQPLFLGVFKDFTARFVGFTGGTALVGKDTQWKVGLRFLIDEAWLHILANVGFYQCTSVNIHFGGANSPTRITREGYTRITDDAGAEAQLPQILDAEGKVAEDQKTMLWNIYQKYPHKNLNELLGALNLPQTLDGYRVRFE